jgi:hypothetical protein
VHIRTRSDRPPASAVGEADFPYVPGLFAFRELPTLLAAFAKLTATPASPTPRTRVSNTGNA